MAKDTEKLIRQLSLISYLMAERRPVTATEIRRDVEGYSGMNEDAFARRFYADRAELEALGINLAVDKPADGVAEQENYSLPPENFFLPAIEFTDAELAALGTTASAGGTELSSRLAKVETAIFRRKTITFEYHSLARDEVSERKVDPYSLVFRGGQYYFVGHAHARQGRLRDEGRARLRASGALRPARLRQPHRLAARRRGRHGQGVGGPPDRLADRAPLRSLRRAARGGSGGARPRLQHRVRRHPPAHLLGAGARRARAAARPPSACRRCPGAGGAPGRAAHGRAGGRRRGRPHGQRGGSRHGR